MPDSASRPSRAILFVDDSSDLRMVISAGLEHFGYRVLTSQDSKSALEAISHGPLDLIILDMGLPDIDGVKLGSMILQRLNRKPPLVLFTGSVSTELAKRAKEAGFTEFWIKPLGLHTLRAKIEAILNR
jgi:CheY-like chemotaxis protein